MKKGRSLEEVLREIEEFSNTKEDYIINTQGVRFECDEGFALRLPDNNAYGITEIAHGQIAGALNIPNRYYDRMRTMAPDLLANNVNHWFQNNPQKRMIRTLKGDARAFLSDRYRRLDNEDLAEAMLPILGKFPNIRIESCEVTDSRFYIKAVTEQLSGEVSKGDIVYGGVVLSNSEVGQGALKIEPMIFRLVCKNGLIVPDYGMKKFHIGRVQGIEEMFARLSEETIEADDKAFWLKARDILNYTLTEEVFGKIVGNMREAKDDVIKIDPIDAVEKLSKKRGYSMEEQRSILTNLLSHEEPTRYGLSNAITRTAQEVASYDRATFLEYEGAEVLMMPKNDWKALAQIA